MKTKALLGLVAAFTLLIAGCDWIRIVDFGGPLSSRNCPFGIYGEGVPLYDRPMGDEVGKLVPENTLFVLYPEEYTFLGSFWIKVWADERVLTTLPSSEIGLFVWLDSGDSLPVFEDCVDVPLTEGIAGLNCTLTVSENANLPARLGPGLNRAIRRFITYTETGGTLLTDGYLHLNDINWYRVLFQDDRLWVGEGDGIKPLDFASCAVPMVHAPDIIVSANQARSFEVYNCTHLGGNVFEWYSASITYDGNGTATGEQITGGPFRGDWRPGCPAGQIQVVQPPPPVSNPVYKPPPYVPPCQTCGE